MENGDMKQWVVEVVKQTAQEEHFQKWVLSVLHWDGISEGEFPSDFVEDFLRMVERHGETEIDHSVANFSDPNSGTERYERSLEESGFKSFEAKVARNVFQRLLNDALFQSTAKCSADWYVDEELSDISYRIDDCLSAFNDQLDTAMLEVI